MAKIILALCLFISCAAKAQDEVKYQIPDKVIYDLATAKPSPAVQLDHKGRYMFIMERNDMPTISDLSQPELRIAGLRINPNNFSPTRGGYMTAVTLKDIKSNKTYPVAGLPSPLKASNFQWNVDETKMAFTQASDNAIDLYVIDINTRRAAKMNKQPLNMISGDAFTWLGDNSILYKRIISPAAMAPKKKGIPTGPVVQENLGKTAASVTYQDLIKSPTDEALFAFYATAQPVRNKGGIETTVGAPGIFQNMSVSPDEKYILFEKTVKPYSYLVPSSGFNSVVYITDITGKPVKELAKLPGSELAPSGYDNELNAPRDYDWLNYKPSTIVWIEPLDSGLIRKNVTDHDALYSLAAPFTAPEQILKTKMRIARVADISENLVLVYERSLVKHRIKMNMLDLATKEYSLLNDRSADDAYADPGTPLSDIDNRFHRNAVKLVNDHILYMTAVGSSPKGDMPFLATFDIRTKKHDIIWRSADPYYESVARVIDFGKPVFITAKQSATEAPNFYLRDLNNQTNVRITDFGDPQPSLRGVSKQKITYKRKDGVDLAADLYLPANYDVKKDGSLPVLMWAYPREFKAASDAAQIRGSKNMFIRVSPSSPIFWVMRGYAVMDNTEFPIVGEGDKQPNDNFIDQLTWNAEAAIDKIASMGIGDRNRVGVGGHSYGAFVTANLLAHTSLFKAGIARSGAYNRTLTPFGFQNEERTYWQAPEIYNAMSPFASADKIKTPILLIHGELDNNSGTFPIQSERLYNAIKGHGGTVRYVQLPYEAHGYAARENLLHMLWEMDTWLNKYVKNNK